MHVCLQLYKQHFSEQLDDDDGDGDEGGSQPPKKRAVCALLLLQSQPNTQLNMPSSMAWL